jgi:hypothetical protein
MGLEIGPQGQIIPSANIANKNVEAIEAALGMIGDLSHVFDVEDGDMEKLRTVMTAELEKNGYLIGKNAELAKKLLDHGKANMDFMNQRFSDMSWVRRLNDETVLRFWTKVLAKPEKEGLKDILSALGHRETFDYFAIQFLHYSDEFVEEEVPSSVYPLKKIFHKFDEKRTMFQFVREYYAHAASNDSTLKRLRGVLPANA